MNYFLVKSEPFKYSWDQFNKDGQTFWDGVRNYQARNMLRDQMQVGDAVFFYHSNCDVPSIVGIAQVVRAGYPDDSAMNPESPYYDPKHTNDKPRWYRVDVEFTRKLKRPISLAQLRTQTALQNMPLVQKGSRLSVMPVSDTEWQTILTME